MEKSNLVLFEQVQNTIVVLFHDGIFTAKHFRNIHLHIFGRNAMLSKVVVGVVKVLARLQQGFRRNATYVGTGTARRRTALCVFPLIDTRHLKTKLRSTNGSDVTTRATANDYDVELFTHDAFLLDKKRPQ